jgi:predicted phage-related endonuclease
MENQAQQLFAEARTLVSAQPDAPVVLLLNRWARFQWWRDEVRLLQASGYSPRGVARFGYRLLKLAARTARRKAGGLKRRLLRFAKG